MIKWVHFRLSKTVQTPTDTNQGLRDCLPRHNLRFIKQAAQVDSAFAPHPPKLPPDELFCFRYQRMAQNDNTISFIMRCCRFHLKNIGFIMPMNKWIYASIWTVRYQCTIMENNSLVSNRRKDIRLELVFSSHNQMSQLSSILFLILCLHNCNKGISWTGVIRRFCINW